MAFNFLLIVASGSKISGLISRHSSNGLTQKRNSWSTIFSMHKTRAWSDKPFPNVFAADNIVAVYDRDPDGKYPPKLCWPISSFSGEYAIHRVPNENGLQSRPGTSESFMV